MPTVDELFDAWLVHVEGRLEVATVISYRSVVRQLRPLIGERQLSTVTAADLDALYRQLRAAGRAEGEIDALFREEQARDSSLLERAVYAGRIGAFG